MKRNVEDVEENIFGIKRPRYQIPEEIIGSHYEEELEYEQQHNEEKEIEKPKINLYQLLHNFNVITEGNRFIAPVCGTCSSIIDEEEAMVMLSCQFCSHVGCSHCTPQCFCCGDRFCKNCSLQNYDAPFERTICIDCNCSFHSKWP